MMSKKHPRRLKWSSLGYTPIKDRKLLDIHFMDRWGNPFRWTPSWEEIWLLFLEAMRTELLNHPEGAWAQVFRDLAGIAIARAKEGQRLPEYPKLIDELIEMVYLGAYLEEKYPNVNVRKKVRLGPVELHFKKIDKETKEGFKGS